MKINKGINIYIEAIDFIYKKYSNDDNVRITYEKLIERGISKDKIDKLFCNFLTFEKAVFKQINVDKELIPFFLMEYHDGKRLLLFIYLKYKENKDMEYQDFLDYFIKNYLYEGPQITQKIDLSSVLKIINELDIEDSKKLVFINFYLGGSNLFNKILTVINDVAKLIQEHYQFISLDIDDVYNYFKTEQNIINYLNEYISVDKSIKGNEEVTFLVASYNQITMNSQKGNNKIYIGYLGIKLNELKNNSSLSETKLLNVLKIIADPTRFKILQILKQGPNFGNEIAKQVELTPATVNHHLNVLINEHLIKAEINEYDNKKIFYRTQATTIEEIIIDLRRILL